MFSRYTWLRPITKKSAKIVTENVKTIFEVFGCPAIVQCDHGGEFLGDFSKYLKENKMSVIDSSPNHPQSQGEVERMHGTLKRLINYDYLKHDNICVWARNIRTYERLLNEVHKEELAWLTPFNAFFLRAEQIKGKSRLDPNKILELVRNATRRVNLRTRKYREKKLKIPRYEIGDDVYISILDVLQQQTGKKEDN